ncbi:MAG: SH3 domain-containing protein [Chloroflexi bacterium]|nr:SH3 domain-containing protein [Chloroflexota bacterium]
MVQSLQLAFTGTQQALTLRAEPDASSASVATIAMQTDAAVLERTEGEELLPNGRTRPIFWYRISVPDTAGNAVEGWVAQSNVFIENRRTSEILRIVSGEPISALTLDHVQRVFSDSRFGTALGTSLPADRADPAYSVHPRNPDGLDPADPDSRGGYFPYIYAIPLGISTSRPAWCGSVSSRSAAS